MTGVFCRGACPDVRAGDERLLYPPRPGPLIIDIAHITQVHPRRFAPSCASYPCSRLPKLTPTNMLTQPRPDPGDALQGREAGRQARGPQTESISTTCCCPRYWHPDVFVGTCGIEQEASSQDRPVSQGSVCSSTTELILRPFPDKQGPTLIHPIASHPSYGTSAIAADEAGSRESHVKSEPVLILCPPSHPNQNSLCLGRAP